MSRDKESIGDNSSSNSHWFNNGMKFTESSSVSREYNIHTQLFQWKHIGLNRTYWTTNSFFFHLKAIFFLSKWQAKICWPVCFVKWYVEEIILQRMFKLLRRTRTRKKSQWWFWQIFIRVVELNQPFNSMVDVSMYVNFCRI